MGFFQLDQLSATEMLPGVFRKAVWLDNVMVTFFEFEPHAEVPAHDHPNEQITYVLEGELELTMGNETRVLKAGDGATVPGGIRHSAKVLDQRVVAIDAWNPVREEYKGE